MTPVQVLQAGPVAVPIAFLEEVLVAVLEAVLMPFLEAAPHRKPDRKPSPHGKRHIFLVKQSTLSSMAT